MTNSDFKMLKHQHGIAALLTSVIILILTTLIVLFVNRSAISEEKTAIAQYRITQSYEAAEAALETMVGFLQNATTIATYSTYTGGNVNILSSRYYTTFNLDAANNFKAAIYLCRPYAYSSDTDRCVQTIGDINLGDITPDVNRRNVIRILSIGTADGCNPSVSSPMTQPQFVSFTQCIYKSFIITDVFPVKGSIPMVDALVTTGTADLFGSQCIQNTTGQGNAVRYGGALANNINKTNNTDCAANNAKGTFGPVTFDNTLPPANTTPSGCLSGVINCNLTDPNAGKFFKDTLGDTPANIYAQANLKVTNGTFPNPIASGSTVWMTGAYTMSGNQNIGTPSNPVILVIDGTFAIHGNVTCYCVIFVNGSIQMTGGATIYGGIAVDGTATVNGGNNTIIKDDATLDAFGKPYRYDRIAGSWKDW
ncbi:hypothetical protein [Chitinibacter sp. GC72]|uniref:pilus assembly PilX family protein n=1 Tax=Chitinibacter sp. GC72 TaxID=1526917 RepID=UPI0012FA0864|nr:hypothetical protein [Chitinibacter sp. GC72]